MPHLSWPLPRPLARACRAPRPRTPAHRRWPTAPSCSASTITSRVRSTAPSMNGQTAQIYVRERVEGRSLLHGSSGVVLFVHGAGTPAEVAFDVPYGDYSWMAYLAHGGFDVFSMDITGYGRSTRPTAMNDPVQPRARAAGALRAGAHRRAVRAVISGQRDDDCVGLERHRRRRRVPARAAACRARQPGRLVAGRSARRRLRGAASRERAAPRPARAGVRPRRQRRSARRPPRHGRLQHAVAAGIRRELGPSGRLPGPVRQGGQQRGVVGDGRVRSRRARRGAAACGARRRCRAGDGTAPSCRRTRRRR